jgi:hypothetical protein
MESLEESCLLHKYSSKDVRHRGDYKKLSNNVEAFDCNVMHKKMRQYALVELTEEYKNAMDIDFYGCVNDTYTVSSNH